MKNLGFKEKENYSLKNLSLVHFLYARDSLINYSCNAFVLKRWFPFKIYEIVNLELLTVFAIILLDLLAPLTH